MSRKEILPPFSHPEVLEKRLSELKLALRIVKEKHPPELEGKIQVFKSHGTYQYQYIEKVNVSETSIPKKTIKYISKKQTQLLTKYAQKEYDENFIKIIQNQIEKIEDLLPFLYKNPSIEALQKVHEGKQIFITPAMLQPDKYAKIWLSVDYRKKGFKPNTSIYITAKGDRVRSKSEIIIADTLTRLGIPYRYEFPIKLYINGSTQFFHPDFYCLNLNNRHEFIWEHFGMVDKKEYAESITEKIEIYHQNNYFEGENLIITLETEKSPLTTKNVEQLAKHFLL